MAQFIPFAPHVEVNGQTVLSVVNALPAGQETRREILVRNGIENPDSSQWYSQEAYLNAFKELADKVGPHTLFAIGKSIPEHAAFPPQIDNLEKALQAIDVAYQMNHRGGEIGHYKLLRFDAKNKTAEFECKNPYPSEFDRGILTTMLRKFKPVDSFKDSVVLDTTQPTRLNGADSCRYRISW